MVKLDRDGAKERRCGGKASNRRPAATAGWRPESDAGGKPVEERSRSWW